MPIEAGKFDPVTAFFYPKTITYVNNEPVETDGTLFYETWIRFPFMARTGNEMQILSRPISAGQVIVRVRRDEYTEQIDSNYVMVHNNQRYGIVSINPIPSLERDEIEFLMEYVRKAA